MDAMSNIKALFEKAQKLDMPGLAITDHGTIAGVPEFLKTAEDFPTVKPIAGCEFWLGDPSREHTYHLILLAKNRAGYDNLVKLTNLANSEGVYRDDARPHIGAAMLAEHHEGLICTSACIGGEIPQRILAGDIEGAREAALWYRSIFGEDFYLEVSLHKNLGAIKLSSKDNPPAYKKQNKELVRLQKVSNEGIFALAKDLRIKVVATNDVHFVSREDGVSHDVMRAILHQKSIDNPKRIRYSHLEYLKAEKEMRCLFPGHPEVIDNTVEILDKVERYSIWEDAAVPQLSEDPDAALRILVSAGAIERFGAPSTEQKSRIEEELSVIREKGYACYLLIIKDIVDWVRSKGWAVAPGRSSAPGSMVNYCLGITNVDPMAHGLLFERFLHVSQAALPSIDLDLDPAARVKVLDHLKEKYGKDCAAEIVSFERFGTNQARKSVLRKGLTKDEANLVASKLVKVIKDEHIHSCCVLVSPVPLKERIPLRNGVSEYEAKWCDMIGVLRLNLLSLGDLRVIRDTVDAIEKKKGVIVSPERLPLDNQDALAVFATGDTAGLFQFCSKGIRKWLQELRPSSFYDLVALDVLYRPGGLSLIPEFVDRKRGRKEVDFILPEVADILGETCGIVIYQEQQMRLCETLAGFSPGLADNLRKAFNMRKYMLLDSLHDQFLYGGVRKGFKRDDLERVWTLMDHPYAFNKSHALCYTWIDYQKAWLKACYPEEFFCALANAHLDMQWEMDEILEDAARHNVNLVSPDSSESGLFEVEE